MITTATQPVLLRLSITGFAVASAILAYEPVNWLVRTWRDPSYESTGIIYLAVIAGLVIWSATSRRVRERSVAQATAIKILLAAALMRLLAQVAAINIIGGIALALDVYALMTWFGLPDRERPVSPFWASVLFLFTLPFERVAQRVLGYPMQEASAFGACHLLSPIFADLVCEGVRLRVSGQDVLVDLPCSGTSGLMLALATVTALNAVFRPGYIRAATMLALTIVLAIAGNALRVTLLAVGLVFEPNTGIDVMAQPMHDIVGYTTLILTLLPVVWLYQSTPRLEPKIIAPKMLKTRWKQARFLPYLSGAFVVLALVIVSLPRQALDVSRRLEHAVLPASLNQVPKRSERLTRVEQAYFEQFGGTAQKAIYGPMALTVVQTTSPLRHLHAPDDCLRGLGYDVSFMGTRFEPVPTALYKAEDAYGRAWMVAVTFTASNGFATSNVAEAIWHWLQHPGTEWQSVQRITPWTLGKPVHNQFETAAIAALDLSPVPPNPRSER